MRATAHSRATLEDGPKWGQEMDAGTAFANRLEQHKQAILDDSLQRKRICNRQTKLLLTTRDAAIALSSTRLSGRRRSFYCPGQEGAHLVARKFLPIHKRLCQGP